MAIDNDFARLLSGRPSRIADGPSTAKVIRVDGGVFVTALDDDTRFPVGPCRGPAGLAVDDIVLLIWTDNDQPWIAQVDAIGG